MSREILFIGRRVDNGEWIEGHYFTQVYHEGTIEEEWYHFIKPIGSQTWEYFRVEPKPIRQFTGLTDKNGTKIFEGDILRLCNGTYPILVYWDCLGWKFLRNGKRIQGAFECDIKHDIEICEVIGNIFDNPELLGE